MTKSHAERVALAALVALVCASYLGARTFLVHGTPVLLGGDQGFFWMHADRILGGQLPYRDFFEFTPPGTDLAFALAFASFGEQVWVANVVVVALGTCLGLVCFALARRLVSDASASLAAVVFTVLVYGHALNATHHFWSILFVALALLVFPDDWGARRARLSGIALGLAAVFTHFHAFVSIAAFLAAGLLRVRGGSLPRESFRTGARSLVGAAVGVFVTAMLYFIVAAGPIQVLRALVLAPLQVGLASRGAPYGLPEAITASSLPWLRPYLTVYALVPAAYVGSAALLSRATTRASSPPLVTLILFTGTALLLETCGAFVWIRLFGVALPAIVLLAWLFERHAPPGWRLASWLAIAYFARWSLQITYGSHPVSVRLPGGEVATDARTADKLHWLAANLDPRASVFSAAKSSLYLPLGRHDPVWLDSAVPGGQTPEASVTRTIGELRERHVRYVLWADGLGDSFGPGMLEPLSSLRDFLHASYRRVRLFEDGDELWETTEP